MNNTALAEAAAQLRKAETECVACAPVRHYFTELSAEERLQAAYQIKQLNHQHWRTQRQMRGAKIGMTSSFMQELFGITQPDYGNIYQDMRLQSGDCLSLTTLIAPKLEVEWALELNRDITTPINSIDELMDSIANVNLAFEIVDSRILNWDVQALDLIADNGSSGRHLLSSTATAASDIDLLQQTVALRRNGDLVNESAAKDTLGHPWEFAQWLTSAYIKMGSPLRKGDLLLTGTITPIQELSAGEIWTASSAGFTDITLTISE
jgi:2-keto-4-pentenoate hydratase